MALHGEAHRLAVADLADVAFVDIRLDLHLCQVAGDHEQGRRVQAGGDGLAGLDAALDHRAVDRRADHRVGQVGLRPGQTGLGRSQGGPGRIDPGADRQELLGGEEALVEQRPVAAVLVLGLGQGGAGLGRRWPRPPGPGRRTAPGRGRPAPVPCARGRCSRPRAWRWFPTPGCRPPQSPGPPGCRCWKPGSPAAPGSRSRTGTAAVRSEDSHHD